jgi:hypothetical protein
VNVKAPPAQDWGLDRRPLPFDPLSLLKYNAPTLATKSDVRKLTVAALVLFTILSLVFTYPLLLHPADAVEDRQDALLNVWITAWDGHQILADPLHLFDANIFYPYPRTLAYSELLLGNALLALPITAASGNPVLGYNAALFLSFILSGLGTYLLVLKLTRSHGAGIAAGVIFTFSSYRMSNLAQAQLVATLWIPFTFLAFHQLLRRPRPRHLVTFVLFFWLQALSSFYYGILLALAIVGWAIYDLRYWIGPRLARHVPRLGYLVLAAACLLCLVSPFAIPYFQVQREMGFQRTLADAEPFSASLQQYVMVPSGSLLHGRWLLSDDTPITGGYPVDALFPGLAAMALALWGLFRGRGRLRWFFLLLLLASFVLSLGPRLYLAPGQPAELSAMLPYTWLYHVVPGFKALRAPARFDVLVMLALAVLAGYGVASLRGRLAGSREKGTFRSLAVAGSLVLVTLESLVWPAARVARIPVAEAVPSTYSWLAEQSPAPILELPMAFTPGGPQLEYQYLSTYHWHPTPDGYSGFIPPKHGQIVYEMERFPSERSISLLQALHVRYVVLHADRYPPQRWPQMQNVLAQANALTLVQTLDTDRVYAVADRAFDPKALRVDLYLPPHAATGESYTAYVVVVNGGALSYAVEPTGTLQPTVLWTMAGESKSTTATADVPLVTSPDGGAAVIPLALTAPTVPGTYRLSVGEQDGLLGAWQSEGTVQVGDRSDDAFPVPARLESWQAPATAQPGDPLEVHLTWRALGKIDAYYSVYVKLFDGQDNAVAAWDGQPQNGEAPTLLWVPDEAIQDVVTLAIPEDVPAGVYHLEVGMYRAQDLARCLTLDADGVPLDRVALGTIAVTR